MNAATLKIGQLSIELPPEPQYEEKDHRYRDPDTGDPLASVTQILASAGMKHEWAPGSEVAQRRGSRVHMAVSLDMEDDLDESSVRETDWPYIKADREFRKRHHWRSLGREIKAMHPLYRYAGRLDDLGIIAIKGKFYPAIRDLKTGAAPWYVRYQITAYLLCFPDHRKFARLAVGLTPDGAKIEGPWYQNTWDHDVQVWMACLKIHEAKNRR